MADLLWQKPGVAVDAQIQTFLAGDDVILDREFFLLSEAHFERYIAPRFLKEGMELRV